MQTREGFGARALEFAALTAIRSHGMRGAHWDEIELENVHWIIPAQRMKMDRDHRVPLSPSADRPAFGPHSFRKTLGLLANDHCKTPEQFKAWSMNLGHENIATTLSA